MAVTITKDMIIAEILEVHPDAARVLLDHGMACVSCSISRMGTLAEGARIHGIDPEILIRELNQAGDGGPENGGNE